VLHAQRLLIADVLTCMCSRHIFTSPHARSVQTPRKPQVHVLHDGRDPGVEDMVTRLQLQCSFMGRDPRLAYVRRRKAAGVPHHAKAGNINSCLLLEGEGRGDFVLVLDCGAWALGGGRAYVVNYNVAAAKLC
jgi:hypothetical protein